MKIPLTRLRKPIAAFVLSTLLSSQALVQAAVVDVFIATGQSNAFYPNDQGVENYYGFGRGVQAALTASGQFSNPIVVMDGAPGFSIAGWWAEYLGGAENNHFVMFKVK
jgi:hypothetical protein